MSSTMTNEETRRLWLSKQRKERAKIRLCDDMQREIATLLTKATYWRNEHAFRRSCGREAHNILRIEEAAEYHRAWSEKALSKHYDVEKQIDKLIVLTAARKKLQQQLGIPPTDDGYVDCGKRFLLLDHELDSTTSVRHYIDENMGGSSLFADEEWRP